MTLRATPRHVIVVDLGFGDAGKGTVVDRLCATGAEPVGTGPVRAVVRFNGGAQAAHNVVTVDGRHHTFAQFGSGTFTAGVVTHLSRFMLVDPFALAAEAAHLRGLGVTDALARLSVDGRALLTTPYHAAANRARERARGDARHGSCGMGIGETARYALAWDDAPRIADCPAPARLRRRLAELRDRLTDELGPLDAPPVEDCVAAYRAFAASGVRITGEDFLPQLLRCGSVVFEGAQGVLLDEWHGFHPYTTWSTTTFAGAETLLAEAGMAGEATRLGVVRTYATRHGPGPFVTEDPALTAALLDAHNGTGPWQGTFRVGHFDVVAHRYAVEVAGGVDALAVTHLDVAAARPDLKVCGAYDLGGERTERLVPGPARDLGHQERLTARLLSARPVYATAPEDWCAFVAAELGAPVVLGSYGPSTTDKREFAPVR